MAKKPSSIKNEISRSLVPFGHFLFDLGKLIAEADSLWRESFAIFAQDRPGGLDYRLYLTDQDSETAYGIDSAVREFSYFTGLTRSYAVSRPAGKAV